MLVDLKKYTVPFVLLAALILLFFWKLAFTNLIFARGDTFYYFYPYWDFRAAALRSGVIPLWNPNLFMGAPFLANPQAGVLYPLNWPLAFFSAPLAVKIAILVHLAIAAGGTFALARRLRLSASGALLAAILFALGGHFSAKVEQVNQLQGLAWLPWLLLAWDGLLAKRKFAGPGVAAALALQLTAGHTQTTFISLIALGVLWLARGAWRARRNLIAPPAFIVLGALLAAAQLVPTLELAAQSNRSGGLSFNEAVSFSLSPLLLGRALLPGFSRALTSEFVGYVGVLALLLVVAGAVSRSAAAPRRGLIVLTATGLFLALGGFNPVYWLLVRVAPGFDLFRAPARWLALFALGSALLAGRGLDSLAALDASRRRRISIVSIAAIAALIGLTFAGARIIPPGETGPIGAPVLLDLLLWIGALLIGLAILHAPRSTLHAPLFTLLIAAELFLASQQLPLNNLTTPAAYHSVRPAMTQLLVERDSGNPPARFLSMSALQFDPGDLTELRGILEPQLPPAAVFDAIVAAKAKEVLSPNLPLAWGAPAVDGYDGGVLPLRAYAQFAARFTGGEPSPDGRLREFVRRTPHNWLLNVTNTRWLIADKVGDAWLDDVFYDLQFEYELAAGESVEIAHTPAFDADAVGLVLQTAPGADTDAAGLLRLTLAGGERLAVPFGAADVSGDALRIGLGRVVQPERISIESTTGSLALRGASLIDTRTGAFQSLALGPYRLAHSGDVKVYENLNVLPRAFLIAALPLNEESAVIGTVEIRDYAARRIALEVVAPRDGVLIISEAKYPGWRATLDGAEIEIGVAAGFFRALEIPAGAHSIALEFRPASWTLGLVLSAAGLLVWIGWLMREMGRGIGDWGDLQSLISNLQFKSPAPSLSRSTAANATPAIR